MSKKDFTITKSEIENFTTKYVDGILDNLNITSEEKLFLQAISVFRIPVKAYAFEEFSGYSSRCFSQLMEKMLLEESDGAYILNALIRNRLYNSSLDMTFYHSIAAKYYEKEYRENKFSYMDKAEYLYHNSFCNSKLRDQDLRFFTDDIFQAAIELCGQNKAEIALSHLNSIKKWKSGYWKYHLYVSYCYILMDEYNMFDESFQQAIILKGEHDEIVYYLMIKNLIRYRKIHDAETVLNMAEEKFSTNPQLKALRISLLYSNFNTRNTAIDKAISQSNEKYFDLYASKIIAPILAKEGYITEAINELDKVLNVWNTNDWATSVKSRIKNGTFLRIDSDYGDENAEGVV